MSTASHATGVRMRKSTPVIRVADGLMPSYQCLPPGPAKGAVVVIQEIFGVTRHISDVADRFAAQGWAAIAPVIYHRDGAPVFDYDDAAGAFPHAFRLTPEGIDADMDGLLTHLASLGFAPDQCAVVGFCQGGTLALALATKYAMGAAVSYYGAGLAESRFGYPPLIELAPDLRTPWLGQFGDQDQSIPIAEVEALRVALSATAVDSSIARHALAGHAFNCDARPSMYCPAEAATGWDFTLAWLDEHISA